MKDKIKKLLTDCANFINHYNDGINEAERLIIRLGEILNEKVKNDSDLANINKRGKIISEYYVEDVKIDITDEHEVSDMINSFCRDNPYKLIQMSKSYNPHYPVRFIYEKK